MAAEEDAVGGEFDGAARLTPEERRDYEAACLVEVRAQLERVTASPHEFYDLIETGLEGRYPDSQLRVVVRDRRTGQERRESYAIWRDPRTGRAAFLGHQAHREDPRTVGLLVTTWALGG